MVRMSDEFDHCEGLVREVDKDRFVSTLFAPAEQRRALHALYAFNVELARVRDLAREPMPGEIRLQWWREVLGGDRGGEAGPVGVALRATVTRYRLPMDDFMAMIEARSFDLYDDPMGSAAELEGYGEKTSSVLIRLAAQVLNDGVDPEVDEPARHAGIAYAIAGLLAAFPLHASQRRLYLPLDVMRRHDAHAEDAFAGIATPELMQVLAEMREIARAHLAKTSVTNLPASLMPAFLPAALVRPLLKSLERDADPFVPHPLPAWRRQWLLWRAARDRRRIV
jgi:phytoene synthase